MRVRMSWWIVYYYICTNFKIGASGVKLDSLEFQISTILKSRDLKVKALVGS